MANDTNKSSLGLTCKSNAVKDTARFMYSTNLGNQLKHIPDAQFFSTYPDKVIPGVLSLELAPTIGTNNVGVQEVSAKLYNDLTHKISGAKAVEKPDYFMFLEACKSLCDAIGYLKAVYTLIFAYKTWNKYYPVALLRAYGIQGDWIDMEINDFRAYINKFITRVNSIYMPNIPFIKTGSLYNRTVLLETGDVRHSPTYVLPIMTYMQWDPTSDPNGTMLQARRITSFTSFSQLKTFFDSLVSALKDDADAVDISGWVENAYEGKLMSFSLVKEDDSSFIDFVSSDIKALSVVENAFVLPGYSDETAGYTDFSIRQTSNYIQQYVAYNGTPLLRWACRTAMRRAVLNLHMTNPKPEDSVRAMSLNASPSVVVAGTDFSIAFSFTPDYMARQAYIYTLDAYGAPVQEAFYGDLIHSGATYPQVLEKAEKLKQFNYKPLVASMQVNTNDLIMGNYHFLNQFDNYKVLTHDEANDFWGFMWWDLFDEVKE